MPKTKTKSPLRNIKVKSEAISIANKTGNRAPRTVSGDGFTTVYHTETYGVGATGSVDFQILNTWAVQPAQSIAARGEPLGKWLAQIAQNFDYYEVLGLEFKFRTACSTLTPGLIMFGYEPNPEGLNPNDYQEMRNMYSIDGSVHANLEFNVGPKLRGKRLLTRKFNVATITNYDMGKVYLATIGSTDGALLGFVDVKYVVRLSSPQSGQSALDPIPANPLKPLPTQVFYRSGTDMTTNAAARSFEPFHQWLSQGGSIQGGTLATVGGLAMPTVDSTANGLQLKQASLSSCVGLTIVKGGRYKITWCPSFDYEDLKMFSPNLYKYTAGQQPVVAQRRVYTDISGSTSELIDAEPYFHRGFTGVTAGDPNPGTDVWPTFTWEFDCLSDGHTYGVGMSVLTYNSISTSTANCILRASLPRSWLRLEYLGPFLA